MSWRTVFVISIVSLGLATLSAITSIPQWGWYALDAQYWLFLFPCVVPLSLVIIWKLWNSNS